MVLVRRTIAAVSLALAASCAREGERAGTGDSNLAAVRSARDAKPTRDSSRPTVTPRGIGPLRAGMTVTEASRALGGALVVPSGADSTGCEYAEWRGGPTGVGVMVDAGRIARVDVDSVGVQTAAGAEVGDTEEEVQRLYGGRAVLSPQKYSDGHYLTVTDPADTGFALVFETIGGKVTRYRAGRRPQVEYVERCG